MRISRNLKESTMRQRVCVCKLFYTSGVQVYNHGRLSGREITYLVSSFFPFSLSLLASSRSTYINHFHPRTLSPRTSKIRWTKREREKLLVTGTKWEERRVGGEGEEKDGRRGTRNKGVHYMSPSVVALPLFLLRDALCVTRGDSLDYHFSLSLSLSFKFIFLSYFWTTIITINHLSFSRTNFRALSFFLTNCNYVKNEKKMKSLSVSLTRNLWQCEFHLERGRTTGIERDRFKVDESSRNFIQCNILKKERDRRTPITLL